MRSQTGLKGEIMNKEELHPYLRRALLFLEGGDLANADDYCEKYLDENPEYAYAYVIKLMIRVGVTREEDLTTAKVSFRDWYSFKNAYRFADEALRERLERYLQIADERITRENEERAVREKQAEMQQKYRQALSAQEDATVYSLEKAMNIFSSMPDYYDSSIRAEQCRIKLMQKKEEIERERAKEERKVKGSKWLRVITAILIVLLIIYIITGGR